MNHQKSTLTLIDRVHVIEAHEKLNLSVKELVVKFKCEKTQVYETLNRK